jgi:hypothetical protein
MRLSHTELAECVADPRGWLIKKRRTTGGRTLGYDQILKLGILRFHKEGGVNPEDARQHIRAILDRQPKLRDEVRKRELFRGFGEYVEWYSEAGVIVGAVRTRVSVEVSASLTLAGEVSRVDVVDEGYRGVLLGRHSADWNAELRMPLLQLGLADALARPVEEVEIGVQNLDGGGLQSTRFESHAIARAQRRLRDLAKTLAEEAGAAE